MSRMAFVSCTIVVTPTATRPQKITFLTAKYAEQSGVGVSRVSDQYPAGAVSVSEEWAWITTVFL